ncbi:MAG: hypothetical protein EOO38_02930 [Cytophagaceae bacterium]|nr:MAG: hypothetical protein EOO38_02930 [Cytophagaceae bacterium]
MGTDLGLSPAPDAICIYLDTESGPLTPADGLQHLSGAGALAGYAWCFTSFWADNLATNTAPPRLSGRGSYSVGSSASSCTFAMMPATTAPFCAG